MINLQKICFFFLIFFLFSFSVKADSITSIEVKNGVLSPAFDPNNNLYSIDLAEGEEFLDFSYELRDENASVTRSDEEDKTVLTIQNTDKTQEEYVFYINKEETTPVFAPVTTSEKQPEIPFLIGYVSIGCLLIIALLFKILIIGFKKRK